MNHEFQLIEQHFKGTYQHPFTLLANGDDASMHAIPEGDALVVSTDAAVMGVHWPEDFPLQQAADRAVCAALSDLAAMGAEATWLWSSVFLQQPAQGQEMAAGIQAACQRYHVEIAGGDTVRAPYPALNLTVAGLVPKQQAMRRDAANIGDDVWLWGDTGHAALGLQQWMQGLRDTSFIDAFRHVKPQLKAGMRLRKMGVRCCIDSSDGLLQDAQHIAHASGLQLSIHIENLNLSLLMQTLTDTEQAISFLLTGGEDYALVFCAPQSMRQQLQKMSCYCIGQCHEGSGVQVWHHAKLQSFSIQGYDHFATVS